MTFTAKEASEYISLKKPLSYQMIRRYLRKGIIKGRYTTNGWLVTKADCDRYLRHFNK